MKGIRKWISALLAGALLCGVLVFAAGCQQQQQTVGYQLDPPEAGEEIAVLTTNMGEIKIRLFPDVAPKAVENFTTHIKEGYYDGLTFHRVIEGFMIQGGDPNGDGTGGESIWGEPFEDEFSENLLNLRGSLAMAMRTFPAGTTTKPTPRLTKRFTTGFPTTRRPCLCRPTALCQT